LRALDEAGLGVENGVKKGGDAKKRTKKDKNVGGFDIPIICSLTHS